VKSPAKLIDATPVSVIVPPELIVTPPVKVFVPVPAKVKVPVTEVVPVTDKVNVLVVAKVPAVTVRFPAKDRFASIVTEQFIVIFPKDCPNAVGDVPAEPLIKQVEVEPHEAVGMTPAFPVCSYVEPLLKTNVLADEPVKLLVEPLFAFKVPPLATVTTEPVTLKLEKFVLFPFTKTRVPLIVAVELLTKAIETFVGTLSAFKVKVALEFINNAFVPDKVRVAVPDEFLKVGLHELLIVKVPSVVETTPVISYVPVKEITTLSPQAGTEAPAEPPLVADQELVLAHPLFAT
jgi:hypothetical protein